MGDEVRCTCTGCGPGGELHPISTARRHRLDDTLRPGSSSGPTHALPPKQPQKRNPHVPIVATAENADDSHISNTHTTPPPSPAIAEHVVHYLHIRNAAWKFPVPLVFEAPPAKHSSSFTPRTVEELRYPNSTFHLSPHDSNSAQVIGYECFLTETLQVLESAVIPESDPLGARVVESVNTIFDTLATLDRQKGAEWNRQVRAQRSPDTYVLTGACAPAPPCLISSARIDRFVTRHKGELTSIAYVSLVLVLVLRFIFNLSRRKTGVVLAGVRDLLRVAGVPSDQVDEISRDPRTATARLNLDPVFQTYTMCSRCYALYPISETPIRCPFRPTPSDSQCDEPLLRRCGGDNTTNTGEAGAGDSEYEDSEDEGHGDDGGYIPIKTYTHQSLKHWLAGMLCRPGMEDKTDDYDRLFTEKDALEDIWGTSYLRNFPDTVDSGHGYDPEKTSNCGGRFFTKQMGEAECGRYAFTFSADSFNPSGNLVAKMSVSATGMYMVLLNLPPHLRHKTENMYFAGIIPGPGKPSNDQINHFVQLVVDELGPLYARDGVTFSQTAKYPDGRTCRAILIALVADALAARQLGGFASVTSYYPCTLCKITRNDLENTQGPWIARDPGDHYQEALEWKNAASTKDREKLEKMYLVRWSPLLTLPYWSPVISTVIDSMHNLYLGLIKDHCRAIWCISTTSQGGDGELMPKTIHLRPPPQTMSHWVQQIHGASGEDSLRELLCKKNVPIQGLWYLCYDNGLRRDGDHYKLARRIAHWVGSLRFWRTQI